MIRLIIDRETLVTLRNLEELAQVCDESGKTLGYVHPAVHAHGVGQTGCSPFSDEELQQRRQQRTGRPLAEILATLRGD